MAASPAGFYFPELIHHPVQVTNFRGIYNDHVATHAVALLLALTRGLPRYFRRQNPHIAVVGPYIDDRRCGVFRENAPRFTTNRPLLDVVEKSLWF